MGILASSSISFGASKVPSSRPEREVPLSRTTHRPAARLHFGWHVEALGRSRSVQSICSGTQRSSPFFRNHVRKVGVFCRETVSWMTCGWVLLVDAGRHVVMWMKLSFREDIEPHLAKKRRLLFCCSQPHCFRGLMRVSLRSHLRDIVIDIVTMFIRL